MKTTEDTSLLQPHDGKSKRPVVNRRIATFLVCLAVSASLWVINALSREYQETFKLAVDYVHLPSDRMVATRLPDSLDLEVKVTGFSLLQWKIFKPGERIRVDVTWARRSKVSTDNYLAFVRELDKLNLQLPRSVKVQRVMPDTIWFSYAPRITKTVPVVSRLRISCEPGYRISDSIQLKPATVDVSGPEEEVAKITQVETEELVINNANAPVKVKLKMKQGTAYRKLAFSASEFEATQDVYRFTEARVLIPVKTENEPRGFRLQLLQRNVEVVFQLPLTQTGHVDTSMFRAVADYRNIDAERGTVPVQLSRKPVFARNIRIEPERVPFLIRRE